MRFSYKYTELIHYFTYNKYKTVMIRKLKIVLFFAPLVACLFGYTIKEKDDNNSASVSKDVQLNELA